MKPHVGIIDIGLGNINSIIRMLEKSGGIGSRIKTAGELKNYRKIILPGVGHFDAGMSAFNKTEFSSELSIWVTNPLNKLLGICLGMHLLCEKSEEGSLKGIGLVPASVEKLNKLGNENYKVPHMGWNDVIVKRENPLIKLTKDVSRFYFVHSYKVVTLNPNIIIGETSYDGNFCSAFEYGNIYGVQFHPEKSHVYGANLFKNFLEL